MPWTRVERSRGERAGAGRAGAKPARAEQAQVESAGAESVGAGRVVAVNYFAEALAWIADPAHQSGPSDGPVGASKYTRHRGGIACAVGIPWVGSSGTLVGVARGLVVAMFGAARALPTLGVLTLVALLTGTYCSRRWSP